MNALVDLRRPVRKDALRTALEERPGKVLALTPLAEWLLERDGVPFERSDAFIDDAWFLREGLANFGRLEEAFGEAFGPSHDSWLGLMYPFKRLADYALIEERRWGAVEDLGAAVVSDLPYAACDEEEAIEHLEERGAFYFGAAPSSRHRLIARRSQRWSALVRRARRVSWASFTRRLVPAAPSGGKPVLVTEFGNEWASMRDPLSRRYDVLAPGRFAAMALERDGGGSPSDGAAAEALVRSVSRRLASVAPRVLPRLERVLRRTAARYARLHGALARHGAGLGRELGVRGALSIIAGTPEEYLSNHFLKAAGRPTLFYQHGGYQVRSRLVLYAESLPATHNFVYGSDTAAFFAGWGRGGARTVSGSLNLSLLTPPAPRRGHFLYLLHPNQGSPIAVDSAYTLSFTDPTRFFRRHRQVFSAFAARPDAVLHARPHPCHYTYCPYEPLKELIAATGARNIVLDESVGPPDRVLDGYEAVLLDSVSTSLLQVLAKGVPAVCHTGPPAKMDPASERNLEKAAVCADTDEGFAAAVRGVLERGLPARDPEALKAYLEANGTRSSLTADAVAALLDSGA